MHAAVQAFGALHQPGNPLILYNIWDAGSARAVADAGAKAIATGSFGVARARGSVDGENLSLDLVFSNLKEIQGVTDLPITLDFEAGYGADAVQVGKQVARVAETGVVGINLEDKDPKTRVMFDIAEAAARISAAAASGIWVNARCDLFIITPREEQGAATVAAVIERAHAYAAAGANSLFVPFVFDGELIGELCAASPLPVNILVNPAAPGIAELARLGVARISHGHGPWARAMDQLTADARAAMAVLG